MADEKRAELYTSPGGKFIRADTLPRLLAHWRSFRNQQSKPTAAVTQAIKTGEHTIEGTVVISVMKT